jgi:hypothetical protein
MSEYNRTRANISHRDNDCCESCGYPFDRHERCFTVGDDMGPLVCSTLCGDAVLRSASGNNWLYSPAN